jgi:hypothetical protein
MPLSVFRNVFSPAAREKKRLFQEAEELILEKDSDWFFSFENICETLGFYHRLLAWKEARRRSLQAQDASLAKRSRPRVKMKTRT